MSAVKILDMDSGNSQTLSCNANSHINAEYQAFSTKEGVWFLKLRVSGT